MRRTDSACPPPVIVTGTGRCGSTMASAAGPRLGRRVIADRGDGSPRRLGGLLRFFPAARVATCTGTAGTSRCR